MIYDYELREIYKKGNILITGGEGFIGSNLARCLAELRAFGGGIHYYLPVHMQSAYLHINKESKRLPVTEKLATQILSLPLYPQMEIGQVVIVANCIKDFFNVWPE
jgi:dTDP-4-amino-4,6-dideoxygalactose transaminase